MLVLSSMQSVNIRRAAFDDAEAISGVWEVVCAERVYTAVDEAFTPEQEREYLASLSDREGVFVAEMGREIVGFQPKGLLARQVKIDGRYEDEIFLEVFL